MKNIVPERVKNQIKDMLQGDYTDAQITEYIDEVITWLKKNDVSGSKISLCYTHGMIGLIAKGVEDIGQSGGLSFGFRVEAYRFRGD